MSLPRIAVLASGRGSNLQAILDAIASQQLAAHVVGVFSDKPDCAALARVDQARRWALDAKQQPSRTAFDEALTAAVAAVRPDWVVCAGFMRILGDGFVARFADRLINIHPSLLPKYKGLHTHRRALEAGDSEHGSSVHWVIPALDAGEVIAQTRIPILADDTPETLAARLLPHEHQLLVAVLQRAVSGQLSPPHPGSEQAATPKPAFIHHWPVTR